MVTGGKFGDVRLLLKDMLSRYTYDSILYSTVIKIINTDELKHIARLRAGIKAPIALTSTHCGLCGHGYAGEASFLLLACGHSYHSACETDSEDCVLCTGRQKMAPPEESEHVDVTLSDVQRNGAKRISKLDTEVRKVLFENLVDKKTTRSKQSLTAAFQLNLSPKNVNYKFHDS